MKVVVRLLAMIVLIAVVSAVALPALAESWQTRYGSGSIQSGATGTFVRNMQTDLKQARYDIDVDGIYGKNTVDVVKQFQSDHGLTVNGIFNTSTKIALWNETH